jgi:hypothetical protein
LIVAARKGARLDKADSRISDYELQTVLSKEESMYAGRNKLAITLALVVSILFSSVTLAAQQTRGSSTDWSSLSTVASGSDLSIKLKNGKTVDGKLGSVSESGLSLTAKNKSVDLKREDVLSVHQVFKKSATKATLIGLGVGAGVGAGIGVAASNDDDFAKIDHVATAVVTVLGAVAGGVVGYFVGKSGKKRVLIYEFKQP